ncbi:flagellar basal body P-ring formation chaperone FlgA [Vibrio sp. TH_r3]|nr:flagellar basal body P-ring formation chaperone FlgA [Vibrio sp. TH_r3]
MYFMSKTINCYSSFVNFIGFLTIFFSFFSSAATPEQIAMIQQAAESHVATVIPVPQDGALVAKAANIDSRIKATTCPSTLQTSSSSKSRSTSNLTVLVECPEHGWRVYVPVRISMSLPLVVANRSLTRGEIVTKSDLTITMIELNSYRRQGYDTINHVAGAKMKKNVRVGEVIERGDICVVCRNEKVIIKAIKGELTITTKGTALSDGASGDQVRVKNDKSKRIIEGIVTDIAEITVYF